MRFPRLSANAWVCIVVFVALIATTTEQLMRPEAPKATPVAAEPPKEDPNFAGPFKLGQAAPDFTLKTADGKAMSLSQFRGKRTLLNFFCGCSFCRGVALTWNRVLKEKGILPTRVLVVASFKPDYDKQFRIESEYNGPILYDTEKRDVAQKYDSRICPRVWVLDEQGRILYTNPSPHQMPPGAHTELAVRPFLMKNPPPPGGIHAGAPRAQGGSG
jgi:peroxiredoxin